MLQCTTDESYLEFRLWWTRCQIFAHAKHAKAPTSLTRTYEHVHVRRSRMEKPLPTGGGPRFNVHSNTKTEQTYGNKTLLQGCQNFRIFAEAWFRVSPPPSHSMQLTYKLPPNQRLSIFLETLIVLYSTVCGRAHQTAWIGLFNCYQWATTYGPRCTRLRRLYKFVCSVWFRSHSGSLKLSMTALTDANMNWRCSTTTGCKKAAQTCRNWTIRDAFHGEQEMTTLTRLCNNCCWPSVMRQDNCIHVRETPWIFECYHMKDNYSTSTFRFHRNKTVCSTGNCTTENA